MLIWYFARTIINLGATFRTRYCISCGIGCNRLRIELRKSSDSRTHSVPKGDEEKENCDPKEVVVIVNSSCLCGYLLQR